MLTRVRKWGNSQGLRFAKSLLAEASIKVGDRVRVSVQEGGSSSNPRRTCGDDTS